jgi:hypothetical protein
LTDERDRKEAIFAGAGKLENMKQRATFGAPIKRVKKEPPAEERRHREKGGLAREGGKSESFALGADFRVARRKSG